uniref:Uncharacterized protein n=1 Tax=Rhizophora mucronata TaxID=61149 RepID=A0A2P2NJ62_RHIMU
MHAVRPTCFADWFWLDSSNFLNALKCFFCG